MKKIILPSLLFILFGCKTETRNIVVYSNNEGTVDKDAKTITQKETSGHVENEISYSSAVSIVLKGPGGEKTFDIQEPGYYVINAKANDTIIGGYQKFSAASEAKTTFTQEDIQRSVDSLKNLLAGNTVSGNNPTFFILPYTDQKITSNTDATIVGPYHKISSVESKDGKEPEVYRFYSIKEIRETVDNLEKLGKGEQQ